ncbi:MAG: thiamine-phosphate kinase [Candidatus Rokuibacteriota bacterium]|nr:MAG: thiamine-phosphate kinase [Candidatus Rokubacteria bacterium]
MKTSLRQLGELGLIQRIRQGTATAPGVLTGIGDDTAVLAVTPGATLLATTDLLLEDVHFRHLWASPNDIGWKAMAVNLSDIASMGGRPRWALVAVALPRSAEVDAVDAFYAGMREAAAPHAVVIIGGDTSASPDGWMINVTLLGEHTGTPTLRSAARIGDAVVVTGALGGSAAGLALLETDPKAVPLLDDRSRAELTAVHLRPAPRLSEGQWLGAQRAIHAMIDCSDGLTADLGQICRESAVGARVFLDRLPVAPAVREVARALGKDALTWCTGGGEDYELLATCDPDAVDALRAGLKAATGTALTVIGEVEDARTGLAYVDACGERVLMPGGYEHFHG